MEEVYAEIERKINEKFKRAPAKRKIACELLELARRGVKSPRGGLWTLWVKAKWLGGIRHHNAYVLYWYGHARTVLTEIPELAEKLGVKQDDAEEKMVEEIVKSFLS